MNADGSGQTPLTDDPAYDREPTWAPDGTKIGFTSNRGAGGNDEIFAMNPDGSDQKNITNTPTHEVYPRWSPDGAKIVFSTGFAGTWELALMNADGTGRVPAHDECGRRRRRRLAAAARTVSATAGPSAASSSACTSACRGPRDAGEMRGSAGEGPDGSPCSCEASSRALLSRTRVVRALAEAAGPRGRSAAPGRGALAPRRPRERRGQSGPEMTARRVLAAVAAGAVLFTAAGAAAPDATELISAPVSGAHQDMGSADPAIAPDARYIAFTSLASPS